MVIILTIFFYFPLVKKKDSFKKKIRLDFLIEIFKVGPISVSDKIQTRFQLPCEARNPILSQRSLHTPHTLSDHILSISITLVQLRPNNSSLYKLKKRFSGDMAARSTRIAIVNNDRCKPNKCRQECKKSCPVVRTGKI